MSNLRSFTMIGAFALGLTGPVYAQDADTVVATVNGTDITLGHMIVLVQRLPEQYRQLPDQTLFDGVLEQLIQQTALGQKVGPMDKRAELILENEKRALLAGELIEQIAEEAVTDEALQTAYDAAYAGVEPEMEYNASHILVETEEEAKALIEELEGGKDFAELAREKSTGPSGPNGGELGWFSKGMMIKEFEDAVLALNVGETSQPVQTQFGWHVLTLTDSRQKETPSLDDVRDELSDTIRQSAIEAAIGEVTTAAEVTRAEPGSIDAALLRDGALLAN